MKKRGTDVLHILSLNNNSKLFPVSLRASCSFFCKSGQRRRRERERERRRGREGERGGEGEGEGERERGLWNKKGKRG